MYFHLLFTSRQFGHDPVSLHTIYNKDFALSAMAKRVPPVVIPPPSAGHVST